IEFAETSIHDRCAFDGLLPIGEYAFYDRTLDVTARQDPQVIDLRGVPIDRRTHKRLHEEWLAERAGPTGETPPRGAPGGRGEPLMAEVYPRPYAQYVLLERLGSGGMSEVDPARKVVDDESFVRFLVVKRIRTGRSEDPSFVRMFKDEARITSELHHANIGVL